jgi:hypothetical protein
VLFSNGLNELSEDEASLQDLEHFQLLDYLERAEIEAVGGKSLILNLTTRQSCTF